MKINILPAFALGLLLVACGQSDDSDCPTVEQVFADTVACTGISAPISNVVFFSEEGMVMASYSRPDTVYINTLHVDVNDCALLTSVLRHEFIHYLLDYAGADWEENATHKHDLFGVCT